MFENKSTAQEIIERLSSSYGVKSQRELAKALGIPPNNVSAWVQRGSVPGNSIIKCALDTGTDLNWLVNGELAKASSKDTVSTKEGKALYDEIMSNGGKPVLRRIMDAYGFTLQKELCDLLDISSGTVSTWVRRQYFPGDVVVACALDTGVSLEWLATGKGIQRLESLEVSPCLKVPKKILQGGVLIDEGQWVVDLSLLPRVVSEPIFIYSNLSSWIIDVSINEISNGRWLLGIDGKYDIYDVSLLPGKQINVSNRMTNFSCKDTDVSIGGKVVFTLELNG